MADGEHYRSVISSTKAVEEIILHETAERHGAAAMGILFLGAPWRMSFANCATYIMWLSTEPYSPDSLIWIIRRGLRLGMFD